MAKKFSERTKRFSFSPFPYELILVVSNDIRQSITNRMVKYNLDDPSEDMAACVYGLPNGQCLMFMPEGADMEYVVHESSHVIWFMLHHAGVAVEKEILAYYTGNLSRNVGLFTWGPPKKRKVRDKLSQISD